MSNETPVVTVLKTIPEEIAANLEKQQSCDVTAVLIGKKINLKALSRHITPKSEPICVLLPNNGLAMIFHYGVIVFINTSKEINAELIAKCTPYTMQLVSQPETEAFKVQIDPNQPEGIFNDQLTINKITKEHLEVISDALAKSVILDHHENKVSNLFEKIEPIAKSLQEKGRLGTRVPELLKHIGSGLLMAQEMIGKIEITEKPLLLWEHVALDPLYAQLVDDLEINERQNIIDKKIEMIANTANTSLEVLQHSHSHRLEWYIIILIAIEIVLQLYEMFFRNLH